MKCSLVLFIILEMYLILWYSEREYHQLEVVFLSPRTIDAFPYNAQNLTLGLSEFAHYPINRLQYSND